MTMVELASPMITFPGNGLFGAAAEDCGDDNGSPCAEYLKSRERAERAAAKSAGSLAARRVHQELAQHYAALAQQLQQKAAA